MAGFPNTRETKYAELNALGTGNEEKKRGVPGLRDVGSTKRWNRGISRYRIVGKGRTEEIPGRRHLYQVAKIRGKEYSSMSSRTRYRKIVLGDIMRSITIA